MRRALLFELLPLLALALGSACGDDSGQGEPDGGRAEHESEPPKPTPIDGAARMAECLEEKTPGECYLEATGAWVVASQTECGGPRGVISDEDRECLLDVYAGLDQEWVACFALHEWLLA